MVNDTQSIRKNKKGAGFLKHSV